MSFLFKPKVAEADPADASAAMTENDAVLVDVREADEWRNGHARGARHIPLGDLPSQLDQLPRETPIYLICASGNRSAKAAAYLQKSGFAKPINVRGGTTAWSRAGLPIDR
ncbi:MAG: rhodanese-like domain-containing protein [Candidatus Limnocylindria bacterium]